jgi:hypothetical protein
MDNGGPPPEALVKMIVTEDLKHQKRQMEEAKRSLHQQQQQQMRRVASSSSSSSSSGGSPPLMSARHLHQQQQSQQWRQLQQQHQLQQQQQQQRHQQMSRGVALESQAQQVSNISNSHPRLIAGQSASMSASGVRMAPPLRRQMAVDVPQTAGQSFNHFGATNTEQKLPSTNILARPSAGPMYPSPAPGGSSSSNMMRVRSEPPLRYEHSMDTSSSTLFSPVDSQGSHGSINISTSPAPGPSRGRSLSNPMSMASVSRQLLPTSVSTSRHLLPGRHTSSVSPRPVPSATASNRHTTQHSETLGLFSGSALANRSSISGLSLPVTVEESSSSEESDVPVQPLFSSTFGQKRTLSDPAMQQNLKRSLSQHLATTATGAHNFSQSSASTSSSLNVDPHVTLSNLTNVHCFSGTRTSNTPSPAPYSLIPVGHEQTTTASPAPSSYQQSTTPSSSNTPSPAPLLSLNTFLEMSGASLQSAASEMTEEVQPFGSSVPNFLFSQQTPLSQCNSTGLSASIAEPIPEFYSFLADLHDTEMSLSSRHGASSGHGTPLALTPRPNDQPATPDSSSMLNLPNIIDDLLENKSNT